MKMNKNKYRKGDILRTRHRLLHNNFYDGLYYTENMKSKRLTIKNVIHYGSLVYYTVYENRYIYSECMLREVENDNKICSRRKRNKKSNSRITEST